MLRYEPALCFVASYTLGVFSRVWTVSTCVGSRSHRTVLACPCTTVASASTRQISSFCLKRSEICVPVLLPVFCREFAACACAQHFHWPVGCDSYGLQHFHWPLVTLLVEFFVFVVTVGCLCWNCKKLNVKSWIRMFFFVFSLKMVAVFFFSVFFCIFFF